jgi:dTDP-4-amino-4,6-dideoxygalactose transaminase
LQAAVLNVKLPHLAQWNENRRARAADYNRLLKSAGMALPVEASGCKHVYHLYVIRHPDRDGLQKHLSERGVGTGVHYPLPLHLQPAYSGLGCKEGDFPETERAAKEILSLPMYPELTVEMVQEIATAVNSFG